VKKGVKIGLYNCKEGKVIILNLSLDFACEATWLSSKGSINVLSFSEDVRSFRRFLKLSRETCSSSNNFLSLITSLFPDKSDKTLDINHGGRDVKLS